MNILVSLGEEPAAYLCPRFVGQPIAEARRSLEKAGFKVAGVTSVAAASGRARHHLDAIPARRQQDRA